MLLALATSSHVVPTSHAYAHVLTTSHESTLHRASSSSLIMSATPDVRWENYRRAVATEEAYARDPSPTSALALCLEASQNRDVDPEVICEALLNVEKGYRSIAKDDGGALSRETISALDGAWRLVFTTGTVETQSKIGRKINYFPLRATQT